MPLSRCLNPGSERRSGWSTGKATKWSATSGDNEFWGDHVHFMWSEESAKHIVSIENHEKGMKNASFSPHNEMKCVLCIKESYSKGKKCQNCHICLRSGWEPFVNLIFRNFAWNDDVKSFFCIVGTSWMGCGRVEWYWHMAMSYLTSLNPQLFKNIAYVGSF